MALKLVGKETKRIDIGDESDWIDVQSKVSRKQFNELITVFPRSEEEDVTFEVADGITVALFELFVKDWSVVGEDDKPVPATVDNYNLLPRDAASLVDAALLEHFSSLTPTNKEQQKSA